MATVAHRISMSANVIRNGYLFRPGEPYPLHIATIGFDRWWRAKGRRVRVVVPDGSGRWVGAKTVGAWVVLQKRANKQLFQIVCGRPYSLQFQPPDFLEQKAAELAQRITAKVGTWENRFPAGDVAFTTPPTRAPSLYPKKINSRANLEYERELDAGKLECLILELGQGFIFDAEGFFDFFQGDYSLTDIKSAIGRQRAVGNIHRRRDGYYEVSEV